VLREVFFFLSILAADGAEQLTVKYELVNGIPYNKDVPRDDNYPYCPRPLYIDNQPISCSCSHNDDIYLPSFICNTVSNADEIVSYFNRTFPTYLAEKITISNSTARIIPENIFADKQPKQITWYNNRINDIDPNAFTFTRPKLEILEIKYEPELERFPFKSLNEFPFLRELRLNNNKLRNITDLGGLALSNLEILNLDYNMIETEFPKLRFFPNLVSVSVEQSLLTSISPELPFKELQLIEVINFRGNPLGSIKTGTFSFGEQRNIQSIDLSACGISSIEPGAFFSLRSDTNVILQNNALTTLPENSFRSILETMLGGTGKMDLTGNKIVCCCDINWLVADISLQTSLIGGSCAGGAAITQLPSDYLIPLCPA
ncbi:hypothetical protein QYM36_010927, partial [Artemia franciscana]